MYYVLQVNTGLRYLDLSKNAIEAKGAGYLADALKVQSYQFTTLLGLSFVCMCNILVYFLGLGVLFLAV